MVPDQLLNVTGTKNTIHLNLIQSLFSLLNDGLRSDPLDIEDSQFGMGGCSDDNLLHLQIRTMYAVSYQAHIHVQFLNKTDSWTADYRFCTWLFQRTL
ncbi:hypothetical protein D3C81_1498780 [compost metagenome]